MCNKIIEEFGLDINESRIINGHTPVKSKKGESPIKANGKILAYRKGLIKEFL